MAKVAIWVILAAVISALLWQLGAEQRHIAPLAAGVLASALSLILGVGLGDAARQMYVRQVVQMNRRLAEQNEQLAVANRDLLSRLAAPTESTDELS
jgi:hypothetical protein